MWGEFFFLEARGPGSEVWKFPGVARIVIGSVAAVSTG